MDSESSIYLGADGGYHDDTPENRERFPAPDTTAELAQDALPDGRPVPFTDDGEIDGDALARDTMPVGDTGGAGGEQAPVSGTVAPAGDAAGSEDADQDPVETEPAGEGASPATSATGATAKTRKP